jgi:hypothetical protein
MNGSQKDPSAHTRKNIAVQILPQQQNTVRIDKKSQPSGMVTDFTAM